MLLATTVAAAATDASAVLPLCGNGIVNAGEQCDSGSPLGSPDCNTNCERTVFEPAGLPFGAPVTPAIEDGFAPIFSPRLVCKDTEMRLGMRATEPARVRYRIHLCRNALGVDSFTPKQVRAVMAKAAAQFAEASIILEEESLVTFSEEDCRVPMEDSSWLDALVDATPPGVLAISFVSGITSSVSQFGIGGFCYFFGPVCVNAGAYESLVTHELGHFFGLAHTFECAYGSETESTCEDTGDMICDTPPDRGPLGVSGIARCEGGSLLSGSCSGSCNNKVCTDGSTPDAYDWMSYYHCAPGHFTSEQLDFMRCSLDYELRNYRVRDFTTTTTTSSTTTSTTLSDTVCGDANDDGVLTAGDALEILRAGVGSTSCAVWRCDYDGSGQVSAVDALIVLRTAVGVGGEPNCPDPG